MTFTPFTLLWIVLAAVVLAMIGYRKLVSSQEEETLHLDNAVETAHQQQIAAKLQVIDKWGKLLTAITVVYGIILFAAYTYLTWMSADVRGGL
jgi:hypothetical protein